MSTLYADIDLWDDFTFEEHMQSMRSPVSRIRLSASPGGEYNNKVSIGVWMKPEKEDAPLPEEPDFLFFTEKRRIYELRNALSAMIVALQE